MGIISGIIPGQILYAANLNNNYANAVSILGDSIQGSLYLTTLVANTSVVINNIDVGSGLQNAYNTANAAFIKANTSNGGGGSGNSTLGSITFLTNGASTVNNGTVLTLTSNGTVVFAVNTGSTTVVGAVQLNDVITSQSTSLVATANAVNTVWAYAQSAFIKANTAVSNVGNQIFVGNVTAIGNITSNNLIVTGTVNSSAIIINPITSSINYILSNRDNGATVTFSNSSQTFINVNSTLNIGFRCILTQIGTGNVIIQSGSNVTIHPVFGIKNQIAYQYGSASLFCYSANSFILDGLLI